MCFPHFVPFSKCNSAHYLIHNFTNVKVSQLATSPGVVSLSRIRKEPCVFPGASRILMASFLERFLKNHLQHKQHIRVHASSLTTSPSLRDTACALSDAV